MKNISFIALILIISNSVSAQTPSKNPATLLIGKYIGYSESYSMGVVAGREIIVPGINETFTILANGIVNLFQKSDKGDEVNYKGKYTISKTADGTITLRCKMIEITKSPYPSAPEYHLTFNIDGTIECVENPGAKLKAPPFLLKKL